MLNDTLFKTTTNANPNNRWIPAMTLQRWGGLASFLLALAYLIAPWIYLIGNLRNALGALAYGLADFLAGPLWAACLVITIFALRERIGKEADQRMSLSLSTALLAAAAMVLVALIRSANRNYHIIHPELHLEDSMVIVVWTTLVAGVSAAGWHFLGWSLLLLGSAGWTSRRLPRVLNVLYWLAGISALFVYLRPELEGNVVLLGVVASIWQGILLWQNEPGVTPAS